MHELGRLFLHGGVDPPDQRLGDVLVMNLQTKADFTALMHKFLDPLKPYYSAGCARLHLGETGVTYNQNAIELEAFSRPLWALVPFWVGGGSEPEFETIYRKGLAAGADPENPEYWGTTGEYDQCYVEMAAIACGILTAPEKLWTPLSDTEKQNLAAWLGQINAHTIPDCNWQFFRILVNLALKSVGMSYSPELLEDGLCKIDSYYSGDGWSTDGASVQKDYYIPWAIQYYGLLYSKFAADTDPRRAALYRQRAQLFAQQFVYWFDANGAALPFGRSLTYRFAQNSFWAACIWAGLEPLPLPVMKGPYRPQLQLVAGAENVRPGRHPDHRLLLPADVHGRAVQRPRQPLLGHEELFAACICRMTTPSGLPKPRPCPHWSGSSPCHTPICWCSAGRGG